jgi:hypothetical protein
LLVPVDGWHQQFQTNEVGMSTEIMRPDGEVVQVPTNDAPGSGVIARTSAEARVDEVSQSLMLAYERASTLVLTDEEAEQLMGLFPDEQIEIRPHDGLIYLPHIAISRRLSEVFKPAAWSMIQRRAWIEGNRVYAEYVMVIRGCFVGEAVGAHDFQPTNPKMNYSDSLESARAEALRRIAGKSLSCGDQVWQPAYSRRWVADHADKRRVEVDGKSKVQWVRLDETFGHAPKRPAPAKENGHRETTTTGVDAEAEKHRRDWTDYVSGDPPPLLEDVNSKAIPEIKAIIYRPGQAAAWSVLRKHMEDRGFVVDEKLKCFVPSPLTLNVQQRVQAVVEAITDAIGARFGRADSGSWYATVDGFKIRVSDHPPSPNNPVDVDWIITHPGFPVPNAAEIKARMQQVRGNPVYHGEPDDKVPF